MERLVVIGGAGFLGRSLISAVSKSNAVNILCLDRVALSSIGPLPTGVEELVADASEPALLRKALEGATRVWIRAGVLGGANSTRIEKASDYIAGNTDLVRHVLKACDEVGCVRVVFDGTEQAWGKSGDLAELRPNGEPMAPNFYGASKLVCEKLLRDWAMRNEDRSAQIFRYSRVRAGQSRDVLYYMVKAAMAGAPIRIIGNPAHRISFVHAEDVLRANLVALERSPRFVVYQVSCDRPYSLLELAQLVMAVVGKAVPIQFEKPSATALPFEPFVTGMAWEESAQDLGVEPSWSVCEMIQETVCTC